MLEFGIEVVHGKGSPYILDGYKSIYDARRALDNILLLYNTRRKTFFVNNDFYDNKFPNSINSDYYCIKQRYVSDWQIYSKDIKLKSDLNNKVIYLYTKDISKDTYKNFLY